MDKKFKTIIVIIFVAFSLSGVDIELLKSRNYQFYEYNNYIYKKSGRSSYSAGMEIFIDSDTFIHMDYNPNEIKEYSNFCNLYFHHIYINSENEKYFDSTLTLENNEVEVMLIDNYPKFEGSPLRDGILTFHFDLDKIPNEALISMINNDNLSLYVGKTKLKLKPTQIMQFRNYLKDFLLPELSQQDLEYLDKVRKVYVNRFELDI